MAVVIIVANPGACCCAEIYNCQAGTEAPRISDNEDKNKSQIELRLSKTLLRANKYMRIYSSTA